MRPLATLLLLLLPACSGTKSNLEPSEPLANLGEPQRAQLCRYTTDVLAEVDTSCDPNAPSLTDFDACTADPPWDECAVPTEEPNDVESWEDCVNRLLEEPCAAAANERCWHFRCR